MANDVDALRMALSCSGGTNVHVQHAYAETSRCMAAAENMKVHDY